MFKWGDNMQSYSHSDVLVEIIVGDGSGVHWPSAAAELTKNTGETTLEGGEGRSADETEVKKVVTFGERRLEKGRHSQRTITKKVLTF